MLQELAAANEALNGTNTWSALLGVPCRYYPWFLLPKEYPLMDLRELFLAAIQVVGALRTYSLSIKEPLPMPPMPYHAFRILLEYNWRLSGETKLLTGRSANRTPVDLLNDLL